MRRRYKNRKNNRAKKTGVSNMEFLKRDGEVGLFLGDNQKKYRVHDTYVHGRIGWMPKGARVNVDTANAREVKNSRIIVTNCPGWFSAKKEEKYQYGDIIDIISSDFDSSRLGLPIGVQYHWIGFHEFPKIGDYVMGNVNGSSRGLLGRVTSVNVENESCTINGAVHSIWEIGFRIVNPEYLEGFELA